MSIEKLGINSAFKTVMLKHSREVLEVLLKENIDFGVLCNINGISFLPMLPDEIKDNPRSRSAIMRVAERVT